RSSDGSWSSVRPAVPRTLCEWTVDHAHHQNVTSCGATNVHWRPSHGLRSHRGQVEATCMGPQFRGLRPATSLESYVASPIGSYVAGANAAAFWATDVVSGMSFWGHPTEADAELMASAIRAETA